MTVGALRPKGDDHLRPVAPEAPHDVAQESVANRLDLLDFLQGAVRVVEGFQERDAQLRSRVAKLEFAHVGQLAEVAGRSAVPESGAAARHRDQADHRPFGAVARDRRGAPEAFVIGVGHHDHQTLPLTSHCVQV